MKIGRMLYAVLYRMPLQMEEEDALNKKTSLAKSFSLFIHHIPHDSYF